MKERVEKLKNKFMRIGLLLVMCLTMAFGTATTAFAYVDEEAAGEDQPAVEVVEDILKETTEENTEGSEVPAEDAAEPAEEGDPAIDRSGLTPDGNMDLVDDLNGEDADGMEFLTVTTKSGHTFYIIIERGKNTENVHFLNQVDEADLMALMSDEEKEQFVKDVEEEEQPVITPTLEPEETTEPEVTEPEKTEKPGNNGLAILAVFGVIGVAVIAGYYVMKVKPGRKRSTLDEDLEFYDDEEYENEDVSDDGIEWLDDDDFPDRDD